MRDEQYDLTDLSVTETEPESPGRPLLLPALEVHMFLDTLESHTAMRRAQRNPAFSRLKWTHRDGGLSGAIQFYKTATSPDLLIIESHRPRAEVVAGLKELAQECRTETRVLFIGGGAEHDVELFREAIKLGVNDFLVPPFEPTRLITAIKDIFKDVSGLKLGRTTAFIGAGGGTGSSTIAQNVSVAMARLMKTEVVLADLDPQFGTVALNFDIWDAYTLTDVLRRRGPVDEQLIERILKRVDTHLSLLLLEPGVDNLPNLPVAAINSIINLANTSARHIVLDMSHIWGMRVKRTISQADQVVVTAMPTLAGLQHAIGLFEVLRRVRPTEADPILVLNATGMAKRQEVSLEGFRDGLGVAEVVEIPFAPRPFSRAQGSGTSLIHEDPDGLIARRILQVARQINGDLDHGDPRSGLHRLRDTLRRWW